MLFVSHSQLASGFTELVPERVFTLGGDLVVDSAKAIRRPTDRTKRTAR
jgi:hypothetical protein